jgi:tetratricopeptide (TPR) repeat protein
MASLGGVVCWVVRDRAAQQARAANDLELAMDRADLFQREGKRAEVLAAFDRAELLASQVPADSVRDARLVALRERLADDGRDQVFDTEFEDIQLRVLSRVNVEESRFTWEAAFNEMREALHRYGISIGVTAPAQAVRLIQGRPEAVRRKLIGALDLCLVWRPKDDAQTRDWLGRVRFAADNNSWQVRAWKAIAAADWNVLQQEAYQATLGKQPPGFLLIVAHSFPPEMGPTRLEFLRRIQRAYPADLWANHNLACVLSQNGQWLESIPYYTAALALRPDSPGIYLNRGKALRQAGELDDN